MSIKYRILFCVMVLCVAVPTMAQNIVKISGRVIDADNQPVELAIVRIAGTTTGTSTNLEGKYELKVASADTVKIIYSCLGYREEERILRNRRAKCDLKCSCKKNHSAYKMLLLPSSVVNKVLCKPSIPKISVWYPMRQEVVSSRCWQLLLGSIQATN